MYNLLLAQTPKSSYFILSFTSEETEIQMRILADVTIHSQVKMKNHPESTSAEFTSPLILGKSQPEYATREVPLYIISYSLIFIMQKFSEISTQDSSEGRYKEAV